MVAHFTNRAYGVNQEFQFVKGIWLQRKSRQIRFFLKRPILLYTCATCSELPSYTSTTFLFVKGNIYHIAEKMLAEISFFKIQAFWF